MFNVRFDLGEVTRRFRRLQGSLRNDTLNDVSRTLVAKLGAYIFRRSKTRHKIAQRYGVKPTGILEFEARNPSSSKGGGKIYWRGMGDKRSIFIGGVPFIQKAFRALHIIPRKANALTIPISRFSVHKRVADLKASGWQIFRPKGKSILIGKKNSGKAFVLYKLAKSVKIPRDEKLLPSASQMDMWTRKAINEELNK